MSATALSRRALFSGGAAALAAAPLPVVALADPAPISAPTALASAVEAARFEENPDLLELGADLALARKRYLDALAAMEPARAAALELEPAIPEGLPVPFAVGLFGQIGWFCLPEPADILGNPITLPPYVSPRSGKEFRVRIPDPSNIPDYLRKRKWVCGEARVPVEERAECRRLYDLAVAYETARDDAREASGLFEAEDELYRSKWALEDLTKQIRKVEAKTLVGLLIKAQAANAAAIIVDKHDPNGPRLTSGWIAASLAVDLESIMGEAV